MYYAYYYQFFLSKDVYMCSQTTAYYLGDAFSILAFDCIAMSVSIWCVIVFLLFSNITVNITVLCDTSQLGIYCCAECLLTLLKQAY